MPDRRRTSDIWNRISTRLQGKLIYFSSHRIGELSRRGPCKDVSECCRLLMTGESLTYQNNYPRLFFNTDPPCVTVEPTWIHRFRSQPEDRISLRISWSSSLSKANPWMVTQKKSQPFSFATIPLRYSLTSPSFKARAVDSNLSCLKCRLRSQMGCTLCKHQQDTNRKQGHSVVRQGKMLAWRARSGAVTAATTWLVNAACRKWDSYRERQEV
jgi:hypothetical protein